jgi:hypothetical protein
MSVQKLSYLKATAELEQQRQLCRINKADETKIAELERVIQEFRFPNSETAKLIKLNIDIPKSGYIEVTTEPEYSSETVQVLEELYLKQNGIDKKKNILADGLFLIPDQVTTKAECEEIKTLREEWRGVGDEIRFVKKHGQRPSAAVAVGIDESEFVNSLPVDMHSLFKKIKSKESSLSNFKKRLRLSKSETTRYKQEKNIAAAETELSLMNTLLNTLK